MVREEGGECGGDLSLVVCLLLIHTLAVHRHCAEFITKSIHKPCIINKVHHTHSSRPPFSPPASTTAALALTTAAEYALSIAIAFPF